VGQGVEVDEDAGVTLDGEVVLWPIRSFLLATCLMEDAYSKLPWE
jgi:hypothetical protein